jgi:polysaccharide biosynthesis protein PslH
MHQITEGLLKKGLQVKVVALDSTENEDPEEVLPNDYLEKTGFEAQYIDIKVKILPAFLNLFTGRSYNVERFYNRKMEQRLQRLLQQEKFDIVQLEGLYLTPYIPVIRQYSQAPILYRSHNIEHFIWERMAVAATRIWKKQYLKLLASRLKKYEMQIVEHVDGLVAISPIDLDFFKNHGFSKPSAFIPVGIPLLHPPDQASNGIPGSVYHLGSMDWRPNQEGVEWFLEQVWPRVVKQLPEAKFFLAGKNMPRRYYRYASANVEVAGEVPDATAFFMPLEVMVVPLLSGGGMRVKIIEGMAAAKTIVSTTIGAEGIGCLDGKHILLADQPEAMAEQILRCLRQKETARDIGQNARQFAIDNYDTEAIMDNLIGFYNGFYSR